MQSGTCTTAKWLKADLAMSLSPLRLSAQYQQIFMLSKICQYFHAAFCIVKYIRHCFCVVCCLVYKRC